MWLFDRFYPEVEAPNIGAGVNKYIISQAPRSVTLPQLQKLKIITPRNPSGSTMACISTHISDGRDYARSLGFEIKNATIRGRVIQSEYVAVPIQ